MHFFLHLHCVSFLKYLGFGPIFCFLFLKFTSLSVYLSPWKLFFGKRARFCHIFDRWFVASAKNRVHGWNMRIYSANEDQDYCICNDQNDKDDDNDNGICKFVTFQGNAL